MIGIGFTLVAGWLFVAWGGEEYEVGRIDPVYATAAESVDIVNLARGQTFGELLTRASFGANEQSAVLLAFREQANPRRLRDGTEIAFRRARGDNTLRGIDVVLNADETVRLAHDALGWSSELVETPVWTDTIFTAGEITTDLWTAVVRNADLLDMPSQDRALLLHRLDEVFQWQVDFSRQIQTGDYFRVTFERQVRPDGSMRDGHVIAAELVNVGMPIQAFWFDPNDDGTGTYYDAYGKSVRRAFLRKPLEFRRIASRVQRSRFHPILKRWRAHNGVDYSAARGTPIMATGNGVVVKRGWNSGGYGDLIEVRHANGFVTRYAHLSQYEPHIVVGKRITQGEVIGRVGMTGLATAPHLHYELRQHGQVKDPLTIQLPSGDPVPTDVWSRWQSELIARRTLLDRLPPSPTLRMAVTDPPAEEATVAAPEGGS